MPQATIRTSPEIYIPAGTTNLNPYYKEFVNQVLSIAPDLTVAKVDADNSSNYTVTLSFMGNPDVAIQFQCSGPNLYIYAGFWNNKGSFMSMDMEVSSIFYVGKVFKVFSVGVDGTLVYVMPYSSSVSSSIGVVFGMFTSTGLESPQFCATVFTTNYTYPEPPVAPFCATIPTHTIAPTRDQTETISYNSIDSAGFVKIGYTHALLPALYYGTSASRTFLNIKWGGKYNIYRLYNASGMVWTRPGEIVTINGVEMLSPGYVAVIE